MLVQVVDISVGKFSPIGAGNEADFDIDAIFQDRLDVSATHRNNPETEGRNPQSDPTAAE